jgi:hypothetical protein
VLQKVRNPLSAILGISLLAFCLPGRAQVAQPQTGSIAIDAYNGLAVTAERSGLVQLFNVENPQSPAFVSKLMVPDQLNSVALAGNYVLAAGQSGVHIVDISNPQSPAIGNTVPLKTEVVAVKAAGNLGYAAFGSTLALFDIPSGTLLEQRDYTTLPIQDLAIAGDAVYVLSAAASGAASYIVTKVAIQSYLDAALASFKSAATPQSSVGRMSIYAGDNFIYIGGAPTGTGETPGLEVLQDNGATFTTVGAASASGAVVVRPSGSGLLVFGGAANAAGNGELGILDISDPAITNKLMKPLSAAGVPYDFLLYAGLAYVADGSNAFQAGSFAAPTGQKTAPTLTLSSNFAAGSAFESSLMRLTASVTGAEQIRSVDFYVNDVKVATDGNYPFEYRFVTPSLSMEASLTMYACAQDMDGNRSCSAPAKVDLEKDKTPLRVLSVTPQEGSHAARGGISTLTARFNRPLDVSTVALANVTLVKTSGSTATPVKLAGVTFQPLVNVVSIQTAAPLASGSYTAALSGAMKSSAGMPLAGGKVWHFTSGGTAVWTAAASGNWSVGANWAAGVPPQAGDAVTIAMPNVTVTLNSGAPSISTLTLGASSQLSITASSLTIASASTLSGALSLSGGTLTATGGVTISSAMNWTGGTITGVVDIASAATLTAVGEYAGPGLLMSGGTLNNAGKATLTQVAGSNGLTLYAGSVINNLAGASWTTGGVVALYVQTGDASLMSFNNAGSFVSANTATTTWSVPFSGAGAISVNSGTLTLNGNSTGTISGTINVASDATLNYGQGGTLTGGPETGSGTFNFTAGATVSGAYSFSGQTQITSGTISFGGATSIANLSLAGTGAIMSGAGAVTIGSTMSWTYGTIADVVNIPSTATLTATGEYAGPGLQMKGGTLNNSGKATLTQVAGSNGLTLYTGSVINNLTGASWTTSGALNLYVSAGDATAVGFRNSGSLVSGNTAITTWSVPFSGAGSVSVTSGTLTLNGNSTGTISGTINVASSATLNYGQGGTLTGGPETGSGTFNFTAGATVSGAYSFSGQTQITSGTISFGGATSIANLSLAGTAATMAGSGAVTIGSTMSWTYGTIADVVNIPSTATLTAIGEYAGPGLQMKGGTLNNSGKATLTQVAGSNGLTLYTGSVINNLTGASWTTSGALNLYVSAGDATAVAFRNSGSLVSGNTAITTWSVPFSGAGTMSVTSGTLTLNGNSTGTISGTITVASDATLNYGQGGTLTGGPETGGGTFNFTAGATVSGAYSFSGQTQITSGTISFGGATSIVNLVLEGNGATMSGAGVVTIATSMNWTYGTIADVVNIASAATLTAIGEYAGPGLQMVGGTLNNSGKATLTQVAGSNGLTLYQGSVINNLAGASWTTGGALNLYVSAGDSTAVAFHNAGTLATGNTAVTNWTVPTSGAGLFSLTVGTINFASSYNCTGQTQIAGATVNFGGATTIANFTFTSGTLGEGDISAGTATFASTGSVAIDFPSVTISMSGSASLAGALNLITPNGYAPTVGSVIALLEFNGSHSGNFSSITGRTLANGDFLDEDLMSSGLFFKVASGAPTLQSIAVTPLNPSLAEGSSAQLTATGTYSDGSMQNLTSAVAWASSVTTVATINSSGLASGVALGKSNITASLSGIVSPADLLTVTPSSSAAYTGLDTATQGTWTGKYGADGQLIANDVTAPPAYAAVSLTGDTVYTWAASTSDVRALQTQSGAASRIASAYYSSTSFTIDVNLTDGNTHRVALYLLDWDGSARSESVSILDAASNTVLSTLEFSSFHAGEYAVWNLQGHVLIQVSNTGGSNAVVSGIFFDPVTPAVSYNGLDTATQGTWTGKYGAGGELIADDATNPPAYATVSLTGDVAYTWEASTTDVRALQTASGSATRIASAYYSATNFTIDLNLTDGNSHKVSLYLLDWDGTSRVESISILDAVSKAVLSTETFSSFHDGEYALWNIQGHVLIQVTKTAGSNAVVSGLFLD